MVNNSTNWWTSLESNELSTEELMIVLCISTIIIFVNVTLILVISFNKTLRRKRSNKLLLNLLLSHLIVGLTYLIYHFVHIFFIWTLSFTAVVTAIFTMVMLTMDRYLCIRYPFFYEKLPKWVTYGSILLSWILGLSFFVTKELGNKPTIFLITHLVAIVTLPTFNALVFKETRKHIKAISYSLVRVCKAPETVTDNSNVGEISTDSNASRISATPNSIDRANEAQINNNTNQTPASSNNSKCVTKNETNNITTQISPSLLRSNYGAEIQYIHNIDILPTSNGNHHIGKAEFGNIRTSEIGAQVKKTKKPETSTQELRRLFTLRKEIHAAYICVLMVASYVFCWLPFIALEFSGVRCNKIVFYLAISNSVVDPVTYISFNREIRSIIRKTFCTKKRLQTLQRLQK